MRFCQQEFGKFPRLVGRYCSYLLPKQAGGTPQILVDKTSRMTGRLRVYRVVHLVGYLQRGASDHSQGFEDQNLGSSPGLLGQ